MMLQMLLEIMTSECLDELNLLIMETNLSGLDDVNSENLFFYKLNSNSEKFDGVIIIDNEFTIFENGDVSHNILLSDVNDKARFKELCEDIITKERTSWSPFCFLNNSHKDRIKIINDYIINPYLYCTIIILSADKLTRRTDTCIVLSGLLASIIYALSLSGTLGFVIINSLNMFLLFGILAFIYKKHFSIYFVITLYSFYLISNIFILNYIGW